MILCRHATTTGMYAPGSNIYSITSGLLKKQKKVLLISLGGIDQTYVDLHKSNPKLTLVKKKENSSSYEQFITLRNICKKMRISTVPLLANSLALGTIVVCYFMATGANHVPFFLWIKFRISFDRNIDDIIKDKHPKITILLLK